MSLTFHATRFLLFCRLLGDNHPTGLGVGVGVESVEIDAAADGLSILVSTVSVDGTLAGEVVADRLVSYLDCSYQVSTHIIYFHRYACAL